jgi:hypothetical protein
MEVQMHRRTVTPLILLSAVLCCAYKVSADEDRAAVLPTPHYHEKEADPHWLSYAAQFHGHLGPWAAAGARLGMAGRQAVTAHGYFDVDIVCEGPFTKPPKACFLDGLQVATGATMGKRNLTWEAKDEIAVYVETSSILGALEQRILDTVFDGATQRTSRSRTFANSNLDHILQVVLVRCGR